MYDQYAYSESDMIESISLRKLQVCETINEFLEFFPVSETGGEASNTTEVIQLDTPVHGQVLGNPHAVRAHLGLPYRAAKGCRKPIHQLCRRELGALYRVGLMREIVRHHRAEGLALTGFVYCI